MNYNILIFNAHIPKPSTNMPLPRLADLNALQSIIKVRNKPLAECRGGTCDDAFPASQFLGRGFIPRSWEGGKAGGQEGRIYSTKP